MEIVILIEKYCFKWSFWHKYKSINNKIIRFKLQMCFWFHYVFKIFIKIHYTIILSLHTFGDVYIAGALEVKTVKKLNAWRVKHAMRTGTSWSFSDHPKHSWTIVALGIFRPQWQQTAADLWLIWDESSSPPPSWEIICWFHCWGNSWTRKLNTNTSCNRKTHLQISPSKEGMGSMLKLPRSRFSVICIWAVLRPLHQATQITLIIIMCYYQFLCVFVWVLLCLRTEEHTG